VSTKAAMTELDADDGISAIVADVVDLYFRIEFFKGKRPFILGIYIPLCR
jgi:hypothetical protein